MKKRIKLLFFPSFFQEYKYIKRKDKMQSLQTEHIFNKTKHKQVKKQREKTKYKKQNTKNKKKRNGKTENINLKPNRNKINKM